MVQGMGLRFWVRQLRIQGWFRVSGSGVGVGFKAQALISGYLAPRERVLRLRQVLASLFLEFVLSAKAFEPHPRSDPV